jgi:aconitase B
MISPPTLTRNPACLYGFLADTRRVQDTTGPMTRDELKDLACLGFSADLVMQSFCHTAAYPKPVDVQTHHTLPDFIRNRGGVSLRPGDGIIHSWLNRMLLPDRVGTGGDSHTRCEPPPPPPHPQTARAHSSVRLLYTP